MSARAPTNHIKVDSKIRRETFPESSLHAADTIRNTIQLVDSKTRAAQKPQQFICGSILWKYRFATGTA
jgi:hypothetical protein